MKYFCTVKASYNSTNREKFALREIAERLSNVIVEAEVPVAVVMDILREIASRANLKYMSKYNIIVFNPVECLSESFNISVESSDTINHRDVAEVQMHQVKGEVKGGDR